MIVYAPRGFSSCARFEPETSDAHGGTRQLRGGRPAFPAAPARLERPGSARETRKIENSRKFPAPSRARHGMLGAVRTKHRRASERMFRTPAPVDARRTDMAAAPTAFGIDVSERSGSRAVLDERGTEEAMAVRRPHPGSETRRGTVRETVRFLKHLGVKP